MLGCEFGQGFLFSHPVASDGVAHLLAQDARRDAAPDINLVERTEDENLVAYSM